MFITECWLKDDDTAVIGLLENFGEYKFISKPRDNRMGGGIGCLFKSNIKIQKIDTPRTATFEHLALNLNDTGRTVTLIIIYRPEPTSANRYAMSDFFDEFTQFSSELQCNDKELLIVGDFNFHVNKPDQPIVKKFNEVLDMFGLTQHVKGATHIAGNTLDLVITREDSDFLRSCTVDELLSDHHAILLEALTSKPKACKKTISFRKTRQINITNFKKDLHDHLSNVNLSDPITVPKDLNSLIEIYDSCIDILNKHAPLQKKNITIRNATPWNNADIKTAKTAKRRAEKRWRKTKKHSDFEIFKEKRNQYNSLLNNLRSKHLAEKITKCNGNSKALFKVVNSTLNRKTESPLPSCSDDISLANEFASFFENKIEAIRSKMNNDQGSSFTPNIYNTVNTFKGTPLRKFSKVEPCTIKKLIIKMATKHSQLDPLPTWLVKECLDELLPIITKIVNASLELGIMPERYKHAIIKPLLKKAGLELNPNNYRPISNLSFISKVIEGIVIEQFNNHLNVNSLQDPRQSAYKSNHSTETLLAKIHNEIMLNGDNNKITMLVMLDLSAAFDTIDHNILLDRLNNM